MEAFKVLVVDDEAPARNRLVGLLESSEITLEIKTAVNGLDCLEKIEKLNPHVVFLDIQMPGMNGIEVIEQINKVSNVKVIFQTAHDDFAVQAFEHSACDYLLKPIKKERLDQALSKALNDHDQASAYEKLISEYRRQNGPSQHITVRHNGRIKNIRIAEIVYAQVQGDYSAIHTKNKEYLLDHCLTALEKLFESFDFIRCHRSFLVNTQFIESLTPGRNMEIQLVGGLTLPVSRQNQSEVKSRFIQRALV